MSRAHNFGAGPGVLPEPVLAEAQAALWEFDDTGMGLLEISHRAAAFEAVVASAKARLAELMNLGPDQEILFLHGGARTQFFQLPMSLLRGGRAAYLDTGVWTEAAIEEARRFGTVDVVWSSAASGWDAVPRQGAWGPLEEGTKYLYYCANNTVAGTEFDYVPDPGNAWLIADISSNLLSAPIDGRRFDVMFGGIQKNLGPAGVTLVILKRHLLDEMDRELPSMLRYDVHVKHNSLYNTPCTFGIWFVERMTAWLQAQGGLVAVGERNAAKAARVYAAIDASDGFYQGRAQVPSRSRMNVTFSTGSAEGDAAFVAAARDAGLVGLKGHKRLGGLRASLYNALPDASVDALLTFMEDWRRGAGRH